MIQDQQSSLTDFTSSVISAVENATAAPTTSDTSLAPSSAGLGLDPSLEGLDSLAPIPLTGTITALDTLGPFQPIGLVGEFTSIEEPEPQNTDVNYDLGSQEEPQDKTAFVNYKRGSQEGPDGGDDGGGNQSQNVPENRSGTLFFPGGLTTISEDGNELAITPDGRSFVAVGRQTLDLPRGTRIFDATTTARILGIPDRRTRSSELFLNQLEDVIRDEDDEERKLRAELSALTPIGPNFNLSSLGVSSQGNLSTPNRTNFGGGSNPTVRFSPENDGGFFGGGLGLIGESGRELYIGNDGSSALLGQRGPEFFRGGPGRVYSNAETERMLRQPSMIEQMLSSPPDARAIMVNHQGTTNHITNDHSRGIYVEKGGTFMTVQPNHFDSASVSQNSYHALNKSF